MFSTTTSAPARGRAGRIAAAALVVLLLGSLAAAPPVRAAQGSGPTTDLTGYVDHDTSAGATFAQGCSPAGGQAIPEPALPDGDFVLVGGGWGHGAGLSQYGAQGAGRLGCTAAQILTTYFPGTNVAPVADPGPIVIGLAQTISSTTVRADRGPIPWRLCHYQTGACEDLPLQQASGATWTVQVLADATYVVRDAAADPSAPPLFEGGDFELVLEAVLSADAGTDRRMHVDNTGHVYRWGTLQIDSVATGSADNAYLTLKIADIDVYLRGLSEVPASWPDATLQAQAIAGRSYAMQRMRALGLRDACRCHLYDTPRDQNYEGWDYEAADIASGGAWRSAVDATADTALLYQGQIAETFYSSSHGGHSESTRFVFGGALPYAQPVDDSRWDLASSNPLRRWTEAISATTLGERAGVGTATSLEIVQPTGAAGRVGAPSRGYGGVRVTGTDGSVVWSGDELKSRLGLRSTLVRVARQPDAPAPNPEPVPEPDPPGAPPPDLLARIAANDRISTAVAVARSAWNAAEHVVIAAADRFPDALAGVALAASLEAPLLLTPADALPATVAEEIDRLGAGTAWLLGGTGAISSTVRGDLSDLGLTTRRLAGASRYDTAAEIARAATASSVEATLALGEDWPDAVAASSLAALEGGPPTLLTRRDEVPDATLQALDDLGVRRVNLVGGTAVIATPVRAFLESEGFTVTRLWGATRYATAAAVAAEALSRRAAAAPLVVASASGFADALSAGALAARLGGVLALAPASRLSDGAATVDFVAGHRDDLVGGVVVGGTGVISAAVEQEIESLLDRAV